MNNKITINKVFAYLIAFLLLLDGSSMWQLTHPTLFSLNNVRLLVSAISLVSIIAMLPARKVQFNINFLKNMIVVSILFLLFWLGNRYNFIYFFRVQYLVFMSLTVYVYVLFRQGLILDLVKAFINIWLLFALVTTFFWLFASVLNIIPLKSSGYNWYGNYLRTYTYGNVYFANPIQKTTFLGQTIFRNTGIYAEAPGAANYFIYAIGLELAFMSKVKGHKLRTILLVLTSLTTLSTKVLITGPVLLFLTYLSRPKEEQSSAVLQLIKILISAGIIVIIIYFSRQLLLEKSSTGSYSIRMDDIRAELSTFLTHPIFGVGLGNVNPIVQKFKVVRSHNGLSMGLTTMLATGGLWFTSMYLMPLFSLIKRFFRDEKNRRFIVFGVAVLFNLIASNIVQAPSFIMMVAAGYAYFNLTEKEKQHILIDHFHVND